MEGRFCDNCGAPAVADAGGRNAACAACLALGGGGAFDGGRLEGQTGREEASGSGRSGGGLRNQAAIRRRSNRGKEVAEEAGREGGGGGGTRREQPPPLPERPDDVPTELQAHGLRVQSEPCVCSTVGGGGTRSRCARTQKSLFFLAAGDASTRSRFYPSSSLFCCCFLLLSLLSCCCLLLTCMTRFPTSPRTLPLGAAPARRARADAVCAAARVPARVPRRGRRHSDEHPSDAQRRGGGGVR
jgi:hypothetical protein